MILRARSVVPVCRPPVEDGLVFLTQGLIRAVGPRKDLRPHLSGPEHDLGAVTLLPGLVNAHCHLDYTHMAGSIPPLRSFTDWIKSITTLKAEWGYTEFAASWLTGARMLLRTGTTTVGDIEAVPELLPEVWSATPLRLRSFLEMTGVRSRREPRLILQEALHRIDSLPAGRCHAFLSPHAPYSAPPALLHASAQESHRRRWPFSTHVAESEEEFRMFREATGPMYDWLKRNERDMSDCNGRSPVQVLADCGVLGPNLLAIHLNCLAEGDLDLLRHRRVQVVHCPRSHDYFEHPPFPYELLHSAGLNLSLATDSLVTTRAPRGHPPQLSLFDEMRAFARSHPAVAAREILRMVTVNPARALQFSGHAGAIQEGAFADLLVLPVAGSLRSLEEEIVHYRAIPSRRMIGGEWVEAVEPATMGGDVP